MNFNLRLGDRWSAKLLGEVALEAQSFLTTFANDEAFNTNKAAKNNLIGTEILEGLRQQWSLGNFDELPGIEIRSGSEINGAKGAFAIATNTIYLSKEFISQNASNSGVITSVLLGEIGHFVDINVSAAGFGGKLTAGSAITAAQFKLGTRVGDTSDRFIYNRTNGALLFNVDGTSAISPVQFAQLSTGLALTNNGIFVTA